MHYAFTMFCILLFFFSLLRLPPRPPLFPYTTLFRSGPAVRHRLNTVEHHVEHRLFDEVHVNLDRDCFRRQFVDQIDRKSTRLNSSHPSISYAVFCLKKKKKKSTSHNTDLTLITLSTN